MDSSQAVEQLKGRVARVVASAEGSYGKGEAEALIWEERLLVICVKEANCTGILGGLVLVE